MIKTLLSSIRVGACGIGVAGALAMGCVEGDQTEVQPTSGALTSTNGLSSTNGWNSTNGLGSTNGWNSTNGLGSTNGWNSTNGLGSTNGLSMMNGLGSVRLGFGSLTQNAILSAATAFEPSLATMIVTDMADGHSRLSPKANPKLCFEVMTGANGSYITLVPCSDAESQHFIGVATPDGLFVVKHMASGRCLDDAAGKDGRPALWDCIADRANQKFKVAAIK